MGESSRLFGEDVGQNFLGGSTQTVREERVKGFKSAVGHPLIVLWSRGSVHWTFTVIIPGVGHHCDNPWVGHRCDNPVGRTKFKE